MIDVGTIPAFGLNKDDKRNYMLGNMNYLTQFHIKKCSEYNTLMDKFGHIKQTYKEVSDVPFIPVRIFKHTNLLSVPKKDIVKTMTSSGTAGQGVSQIFLDGDTSSLQVKVLSKIMSDFIGTKRLPMLVIDSKSIISNREKFSARTAGVLGFSMFGRDVEFALDDDMSMNFDRVDRFINKYNSDDILVFGFTSIIWEHFVLALEQLGKHLAIPRGILFHGGGWKKLINQSVDNSEFKNRISDVSNIINIHNYYGMIEQTGSIFVECKYGFLHASSFSDVIIRSHQTHASEEIGITGLIQLLSVIPKSYPGHSILTEDLGTIYGIDDCKCERKGKYFKVHGRIESAEIRGCSDTYS